MLSTIQDNLQRLQSARTSISTAITNKGGTVSSEDGFEEFPSDILSIPTTSPTFAFLFVTTDSGTTVTVSKDGTTLDPQTSVSGEELCFNIPESGTWNLTGTNGATNSITISTKDSYYIDLFAIHIYGVSWDKSESTQLTRTDDSANFNDPNPYYKDMTDTPSSPFDNLMPWSGMIVETFEDGNVMVKIPKFWYKITNSDNTFTVQIADRYVDGFSVSPAHQARNSNETDRDFVYIGRYKCGNLSDNQYKSKTNAGVLSNMTRDSARIMIHNLGSNYWQQDFMLFWTVRLLYIVEFADWDSQAKIGYGCNYYYVTSPSSTGRTGYTDSMPYHTGTTSTSRGSYSSVQYRWIEDLWANGYEWVDGIRFIQYYAYAYKDPSEFSDTTGGVQLSSGMSGSNGNSYGIKYLGIPNNSGYEWAMLPVDIVMSGNTYQKYIPDLCAIGGSGKVLYTGGLQLQPSQGLFMMCVSNTDSTYSSALIGTRLMYLPPQT